MNTHPDIEIKEDHKTKNTWLLLTRCFKYSNGKHDTSSCLFRIDKKSILKDTINRWKMLFGDEKDFFITYQIITIWGGEKEPFLIREDAEEQTINELLK